MIDIFELIQQTCPNGILRVAIKDLGKFEHGVGLDKSMLRSEGPIPVIHYGEIYTTYNLKTDKTVSFLDAGTPVSVSAHHGDVVVCLTETANLGFVGKAVAQICGVDVAVSGDAGVLHLNPDKADAVFVSHIMNTERFQIQKEKCKRGTTVMHLAISLWQKIKIPLPPLQIQREIVAILDKFNAYCNDMTVGLAGELEMRRKQYRYWRDKIFQDLLDEGCGMKAIGELGKFERSSDKFGKNQMNEGSCPGLHYGQIYTSYDIHLDKPGCGVSDEVFSVSAKVRPGDVVVTLAETADLGWVGKAVANVSGVGIAVSMGAGVLHVAANSDIDGTYLAYAMSTKQFQKQKEKCKNGTSIINLAVPRWQKIKVPVPDMTRQRGIVAILDRFRELERELELRRKQYGYYRDMLLVFPEKKGV